MKAVIDDLAGRDRQHQRGGGRDEQCQQRQQHQFAMRFDERRKLCERRKFGGGGLCGFGDWRPTGQYLSHL